MKTQNRLSHRGSVLLLTAMLALTVGCAKKNDGDGGGGGGEASPPAAVTPDAPRDTDGSRGTDFADGATAALKIDSLAALSAYSVTHPVNNPQDLRISVKLKDIGSNQWAGTVLVSYYDNNQYYTGRFVTGEGNTPGSGTSFPNVKHAYYNNWFSFNGKPVFHGFYQDSYGAILFIVDQSLDQGDGSGASEVGGSIWFKNYAVTNTAYIPRPDLNSIPCWFITLASYDCRTFLINDGSKYGSLHPTTALYPTDSQFYTSRSTNPYIPEEPARGWRRLGTFSGLNKAKAFTQ
jgi:hypothetical protein